MYGNGNKIVAWIKGHLSKLLVGFLAVCMVGGFTGPMVAMDDTNDAQAVQIGALEGWQTAFYNADPAAPGEWQKHLDLCEERYEAYLALDKAFGELDTAYRAFYNADPNNPGEWQRYIKETDDAIGEINDWLFDFYNDDPGALGEWQQAMATWDAFYNATTNPETGKPFGEYQRAIARLWEEITALWNRPPSVIYIETEPEA